MKITVAVDRATSILAGLEPVGQAAFELDLKQLTADQRNWVATHEYHVINVPGVVISHDVVSQAIQGRIDHDQAEATDRAARQAARIAEFEAMTDEDAVRMYKIDAYEINDYGIPNNNPTLIRRQALAEQKTVELKARLSAEKADCEAKQAIRDQAMADQLASAVARFGSVGLQERWAEGLAKKSEAINLIWNYEAFGDLGNDALSSNDWHGDLLSYDEDIGDNRKESPKKTINDTQWEKVKERLVPGCTCEYFHQYDSGNPEVDPVDIARISVRVGELDLSCDVIL
jgi:hypothetical protein